MTPNELAGLLLADIGKLPTDTLPAGCSAWLIAGANGALQEIFGRRADLFRRAFAWQTAGPETRTAVVSSSGTVVTFAGAASTEDLTGCSIRIGTQPNELADKTATGVYTLLHACNSGDGSFSSTVYHEAKRVSSGVYARVLGPGIIPGRKRLRPVEDVETYRWQRTDGYLADYGEVGVALDELNVDVPDALWVTTRQSASDQAPYIIAKLGPIPDAAYDISCEVAVMPRQMAALTDSWQFPIDRALHESVLFPIARFRWSKCPYWKGDNKEALKDDYKVAIDALLAHQVVPGGGGEILVW